MGVGISDIVGWIEGIGDGKSVGTKLGCIVGAGVGNVVGCGVGGTVGSAVGREGVGVGY